MTNDARHTPEPEARSARRLIAVRGVVQGVGFRPFVYRRAQALGLRGSVRNTGDGVEVDVEGDLSAIAALIDDLRRGPGSFARTDAVSVEPAAPCGRAGFVIEPSGGRLAARARAWPPADAAPCDACSAEMDDPSDRRHRYAFINCTACGPRFTIVRGIPYDRRATTMAAFTLCEACRAEYEDPTSRRFHAEPNACDACGPSLAWVCGDDSATTTRSAAVDALDACLAALRAGAIVAVRGVGGFHLACDARNAAAVATLRERKRRDAKPFALMAKDIAALAPYVDVSDDERRALLSRERPIVLLAIRKDARARTLAPGLAPGLAHLGFMLPPTPLHRLLANGFENPLVMTSGNVADEPIATENEDALERLSPIADAFLVHDRPIHTQLDDSVVRVERGATRLIRRARGFVPDPVPLACDRPILAVGADLKATFCLAGFGAAYVGQHLGDLDEPRTLDAWNRALVRFTEWLAITPELVACDGHPDYASTRLAEAFGLPLVRVQHHHAHVAACLAEHGREGPVVGVVFDGAGHGDDGAVWGGEILVADRARSERAAHLRRVRLPGGDAAAREPWRMALAYLDDAGEPLDGCGAPDHVSGASLDVLARAARRGLSAPWTTSAGRLFDAVAALAGLRSIAAYEGQAAMELEAASARASSAVADAYPYAISTDGGAPAEIDLRPMVRAIAREVRRGARDQAAEIGARFHETLASATTEGAANVAATRGLSTVVLTGGCFQNARLAAACEDKLRARGLEVLRPERFPPNDGGISLGQAAVAAARTTTTRS